MAEELWLDADRVVNGGRDLASAGKHLTSARSGPGGELVAMSGQRPWGADEIGQAFEKNYRTIEQQVLLAWEKLGLYVEGLGDAVVQTVKDANATDHHAAAQVERTYRTRS